MYADGVDWGTTIMCLATLVLAGATIWNVRLVRETLREMKAARQADFAPLIRLHREELGDRQGGVPPSYVFINSGRFVAMDITCYPGGVIEGWAGPRFDREILLRFPTQDSGGTFDIPSVLTDMGVLFAGFCEFRSKHNPENKLRVDCAAFTYEDIFGNQYRSLVRLPITQGGVCDGIEMAALRWGKVGDAGCPEIDFIEPASSA